MPENSSQVQLQFLGAAGVVTGSRTYLKIGDYKLLIDCGLFQGKKKERKLNKVKSFPFKPSELDAVLLTHGHLDHSGYLPVLVKKGFSKPIHATAPTKDIAEVILTDSAEIQLEDTADENKRRNKAGKKPRKPLYKVKHVRRTMELFKSHQDGEWIELNHEIKLRFLKSGHILGSASIELACNGKTYLFSGDVGQKDPLILDTPSRCKSASYVVLESTYGNQVHKKSVSPYQALQEVVNKTFEKGGSLIIPSFAVERAQEIIIMLNDLKRERNIPDLPVYLDSPMGVDVTKLFQKHKEWHNLAEAETDKLTDSVHTIQSFEETLQVLDENAAKQKIIIAGSGMVTGGRVLYYLKHLLCDERNTVLLVGYQAKGTRGKKLSKGAGKIKIDGDLYEVHASIEQISSLSAHADQEDLLWFLKGFEDAPKQIFLNHGEKQATKALKVKIESEYGWPVTVAEMGRTYKL